VRGDKGREGEWGQVLNLDIECGTAGEARGRGWSQVFTFDLGEKVARTF